MSITRTPVLSSELLASREPFNDRIYVVGPYAGRVSFSSQQRRAISLIWDIDKDIKAGGDSLGLQEKEVAIVGAGVAGLTCGVMSALLGAGAWIHEEQPSARSPGVNEKVSPGEVLATFRDAKHRDAHPTLNFWPQEDIEPFTRLPFLNWHEGDCEGVAAQIVRQFNELTASHRVLKQRITMRTGYKANKVSVVSPGRLTLDCTLHENASSARGAWEFDVVILAVGFGEEKQTAGARTPRYWEGGSDPIEVLWNAPPPQIEKYVVSGNGDGGLIDALRLIFRELRPGNIDQALVGALEDPRIRNAIARIENRAHKRKADHVMHTPGQQPSEAVKDEIAEIVWQGYEDLIQNKLGNDIFDALKQVRSPHEVHLLGRRPHPMELSASPYHRILTAIARDCGWIHYHQIKDVRATPIVPLLDARWEKVRVQIPLANVEADVVQPDGSVKTETFPNAYFVSRHGYTSPLEDIYNDPDLIGQIQRQQALYADQDALPEVRAREVAAMLDRADPTNIDAFFKQNLPLIRSYFADRHKLDVVQPASNAKHVELHGVRTSRNEAAVPRRLWGLELRPVYRDHPPRTLPPSGVDES